MSEDFNASERVAAGAAWLDEHRPGWERVIDLGLLNMPDGEWCICGQAQAWDITPNGLASPLGFFHTQYDVPWKDFHRLIAAEYAALDVAWRALLKERFDSGLLSDLDG